MAPKPGDIHRRPRHDSRAVHLWIWIKGRKRPWSVPFAASATAISERRAREIIAALHRLGIVKRVRPARGTSHPAEFMIRRVVPGAPILTIGRGQRVAGVRFTKA